MFDFGESTIVGRKLRGPDGHRRRIAVGRPPYFSLNDFFLCVQILNVSAVVLANLCVCYLVTSQNEEAEELLRKLEKEEEQKCLENPHFKFFHLSIVNLVIG